MKLSDVQAPDISLSLEQIVALYFLKGQARLYEGTAVAREIENAYKYLRSFIPDDHDNLRLVGCEEMGAFLRKRCRGVGTERDAGGDKSRVAEVDGVLYACMILAVFSIDAPPFNMMKSLPIL